MDTRWVDCTYDGGSDVAWKVGGAAQDGHGAATGCHPTRHAAISSNYFLQLRCNLSQV